MKRSHQITVAKQKSADHKCNHQAHRCRCSDFQPAQGDDNFCAVCACPASYHSARALKGKRYPRCFTLS
jgi:hypothetical protein